MAKPLIRTGPSLKLKVSYANPDADEKTIGFASNLQFSVNQGQKPIFTVDSPYPAELAQGAAPQMVQGTMTIYLLRGMDPVKAGLVPPSSSQLNYAPVHAYSTHLNWRIYDRFSGELAWAINNVKVSSWSVNVTAKQVVTAQLTFQGMFYQSGSQ